MRLKSIIAYSLAASDSWNRGLAGLIRSPTKWRFASPRLSWEALTAIVLFGLARNFWFAIDWAEVAMLWSAPNIAIMDNARLAKKYNPARFLPGWLLFYIRSQNASYPGSTASGAVCEMVRRRRAQALGLMRLQIFSHYLGLIFIYYFLPLKQKGISPFAAGLRAPAAQCPGVLDANASPFCSRTIHSI